MTGPKNHGPSELCLAIRNSNTRCIPAKGGEKHQARLTNFVPWSAEWVSTNDINFSRVNRILPFFYRQSLPPQ